MTVIISKFVPFPQWVSALSIFFIIIFLILPSVTVSQERVPKSLTHLKRSCDLYGSAVTNSVSVFHKSLIYMIMCILNVICLQLYSSWA